VEKKVYRIILGLVFFMMAGCGFQIQIRNPVSFRKKYMECGLASWYGPGFYGKKTANGEIYTGKGMTAAHRTLPFNTNVRVTRVDNGKSVIVRINDRGPWKKGYVIDLSYVAAKKINLIEIGSTEVKLQVIK